MVIEETSAEEAENTDQMSALASDEQLMVQFTSETGKSYHRCRHNLL